MKASELMIGDWVFNAHHGENIQITPCDFFTHGHFEDGKYIPTGVTPSNGWDLEPILITPEILEKNFREYLPGINLMYQLKGPYFAMNEEGNQWVFGLVKEDGEKSCRYPLVKITYVHELQHALRLCGIKKEIVL